MTIGAHGSRTPSSRPPSNDPSETAVTAPGRDRLLIWGGFPILGAALGWLLKVGAGWVASLPWAPFQGPFELVASAPEPYATIGAPVLGGLAGLVLAFLGVQESLTITVANDRVTLKRGDGGVQAVDRSAVAGVFLDGKHLVLLGRSTDELAREKSDLDAARLTNAFRAHGYPWLAEGDPYRNDYRRWVPGLPELPAGADALLKARDRALRNGENRDAVELRTELAQLGVVVRDEEKRQYWRLSQRR
ncbi:YqeB family protein [Micromonospora sp. NPDC003197]